MRRTVGLLMIALAVAGAAWAADDVKVQVRVPVAVEIPAWPQTPMPICQGPSLYTEWLQGAPSQIPFKSLGGQPLTPAATAGPTGVERSWQGPRQRVVGRWAIAGGPEVLQLAWGVDLDRRQLWVLAPLAGGRYVAPLGANYAAVVLRLMPPLPRPMANTQPMQPPKPTIARSKPAPGRQPQGKAPSVATTVAGRTLTLPGVPVVQTKQGGGSFVRQYDGSYVSGNATEQWNKPLPPVLAALLVAPYPVRAAHVTRVPTGLQLVDAAGKVIMSW